MKKINGHFKLLCKKFVEIRTELETTVTVSSDDAEITQKFSELLKTNATLTLRFLRALLWELKNPAEISDDELPEGVILPDNYEVNKSGVWKLEFEFVDGVRTEKNRWNIIPTPVYVKALTENIETQEVGSVIEWIYIGVKKHLYVKQESLAGTNKLLPLSDYGLPVTQTTAKELITYLSNQTTTSWPTLKNIALVTKNGWNNVKGSWVFVAGSKIYALSDTHAAEVMPRAETQKYFNAVASNGNCLEWVKTVKKALKFEGPLLTVGAALSAFLLEILGVDNFTFHIYGSSSVGKTTCATVAFSFMGNPSLKGLGLLESWKSTVAFIFSRAIQSNSSPMYLDDTSVAASPELITEVVYGIGNGSDKGRSTKDGTAKATKGFTVTLISTGEAPLSTSQSNAGQDVRIVETEKSPFHGAENPEVLVEEIKEILLRNYGWGAEELIQYLVYVRNTEVALCDLRWEHKQTVLRLRNQLGDKCDGMIGRVIDFIATMELSLILISKVMPELEIETDFIKSAIDDLLLEQRKRVGTHNNIDIKALNYVWDRILGDQRRFEKSDLSSSNYEMWGSKTQHRNKQGYAFLPAKLNQILTEGGFDSNAITRFFKQKKHCWISDGGSLWPVNIEGTTKRCFVFDKETAIAAGVLAVDRIEVPYLKRVPTTQDNSLTELEKAIDLD